MRITVLGGSGAWPGAGKACSGYLVEQDGFRVLIDPGYACLPVLLGSMAAEDLDAVLVSHGHPDHCADLNPLLRARAFGGRTPPALPVYALPGSLDAVHALDRPGMLRETYITHDFDAGDAFEVGPFRVDTWPLPHYVPNAGLRLTAGGQVLAYTGDTGPAAELIPLAKGADVFLAEATYADHVPADSARHLSSARQAGESAARAGVGRLLLTHLQPGTLPEAATAAARRAFQGHIQVAEPGVVVDLSPGS